MAHEALDPSFRGLIEEHAPLRQLGRGFMFTEGPIWHPVEGHLLFSDMPGDVRRRRNPSGGVREVLRPSWKGNGMTYDADLNLWVCEHVTSSVARVAPDGTREVMASRYEGRELNSPNDICVASDGGVWFTDPTYGRIAGFGVERPAELGFQGVYRLPPGHRPGAEPQLVCERYMFSQPNGLCFSPDERLVYVNDTVQANIRVFEVGAEGRLARGRIFASGIADALRPGVPDGMKCDAAGNLWVTAPGGLWVCAPSGRLIGKVSVPELVANFHWGGADWRTLFLCASTSLYAVDVGVGPRNEPFMRNRRGVAGAATAAPVRANALGIHPARTAPLIQDMQNDVIMEAGAFASSGAPAHAKAQNAIANCAALAKACRRAGIPVIHVWFVCEPGHPAMARNAPLFEGLVEANALVRGTWGCQPVPGLAPEPGDIVVEKLSMSPWETSRLERYLRGLGADTLIDAGAWTDMSIEHTARTGADKGFRVIVPEDCCATMNADWHRASIGFAMANVATITTRRAVEEAISPR